MKLERVKRWQWVVVSVALGLVLAWARRADPRASVAGTGRIVTDQGWFEREVRREVSLADGRTVRAFHGLRVSPAWIDEGEGARRVDLVTGMYVAESHADPVTGQVTGRLRRYTYVAPVPYHPKDAPAGPPVRGDTVTAYLNSLEVRYVRAWWAAPRYAALLWVGGSVVAVGLVWPTLINLLVYGRWRRPPEQKGVNLSSVPHQVPPRDASDGLTADELQRLAAFEAAVTSGLEESGPAGGAEPAALPPAARALAGAPLDAPEPAACAEAKEFGAAAEDFYPTELRARTVGKAGVPSNGGTNHFGG